jgi:hypothetical protein
LHIKKHGFNPPGLHPIKGKIMVRGKEVWSIEWFGARLFVGKAPYGKEFLATPDEFQEMCQWFDEQEAKKWQAW